MKATLSTAVAAIFAALMLLATQLAVAQTVDLATLPEAQRKQVLETIGKAAVDTKSAKSTDGKELIDHAREWAGLGQAVGSGVVAAAKELGVAANEFATTDLGKVTVAVLLWKYMGSQVLGIVIGIPLMIFGCWFGWFLVRRSSIDRLVIESQPTPVLWGLFSINKEVKRTYERADSLKDSQTAQQVAGYLMMAVSFIVGLVAIF